VNLVRNIAIIPEPVSIDISPRVFSLTETTQIYSNRTLIDLCDYLNNIIFPSTGFKLSINNLDSPSLSEKSINLIQLDNVNKLGSEGYTLEITPSKIDISANNTAGAFYGIQTLRQLLPIEIESKKIVKKVNWEIQCLKIEDYPRFSWRGYMLDEARHFHGKKVVKKLLDLMALFKMNKFHWHLTDDQGWRIEIKKFPKLTEIGSKREETQKGWRFNKKCDGIPHSGYYTQEEIQEIVKYANKRFIKIIPEIDLPGHSRAAIASYPSLSCKGKPIKVSTHWGFHKDIFCIGKDEIFDFIYGILNEIKTLFPSDIIHIGGDEVLKQRWKNCPDCQNRLLAERLKDEKELQCYFTSKIYSYLNSKGQKVVCWNDALHKNLTEKIICQYWLRGKKKVFNQIKRGGDVIMSNFKYAYLDHSYSYTPLKLAYRFDPIPKNLDKEYHKHILGLEATMWGEYIPNSKRLEWQTFPRLIAFAEIGWTPKIKRNYSSFHQRLPRFLKRLDIMGINYANLNEAKGKFLKKLFKWFTLLTKEKGGT
jgi:hexosaminidase